MYTQKSCKYTTPFLFVPFVAIVLFVIHERYFILFWKIQSWTRNPINLSLDCRCRLSFAYAPFSELFFKIN